MRMMRDLSVFDEHNILNINILIKFIKFINYF